MPRLVTGSWEQIINAFLFKVQNCAEFFNYYNITEKEAEELALKRAKGYLIESISRLNFQCSPDVDFTDYDADLGAFNFEITVDEIDLFARLMYEMFLEKDTTKLRVRSAVLTSQDLKSVYGVTSNERNSYMNMFNKYKEDSNALIDNYISKDRLTGKRKIVEFNM